MSLGSNLVGRLSPWLGTCHCGNGRRAMQDARAREGGTSYTWDLPSVWNFELAHQTRYTSTLWEMFITTLYQKLNFGVHYTCSARALSLHLYSFFQGFWPILWSHRFQIWWVTCHHGWTQALGFVLSDTGTNTEVGGSNLGGFNFFNGNPWKPQWSLDFDARQCIK